MFDKNHAIAFYRRPPSFSITEIARAPGAGVSAATELILSHFSSISYDIEVWLINTVRLGRIRTRFVVIACVDGTLCCCGEGLPLLSGLRVLRRSEMTGQLVSGQVDATNFATVACHHHKAQSVVAIGCPISFERQYLLKEWLEIGRRGLSSIAFCLVQDSLGQ